MSDGLTKSETCNYYRYDRMAYILNRDAYILQMKNRTKPLKQFYPCPRGVIFTAAMGERPIPVTMLVIPKAALQICDCHPGMGEKELWDLWDTTFGLVVYPWKDWARIARRAQDAGRSDLVEKYQPPDDAVWRTVDQAIGKLRAALESKECER